MAKTRHKLLWGSVAAFLIVAFVLPVVSNLVAPRTPPADLLVVYTSDTKRAAQVLADYLERNLTFRVKLVPASALKVEFRAYPVVVVENPLAFRERGHQQLVQLVRLVQSGEQRVPILAYDAVLGLLYTLAHRYNLTKPFSIQPSATANLYVVTGGDPATKPAATIANVLTRLLPSLESIFAAKIPIGFTVLNVSEAHAHGIPVDRLNLLPAIVVKSKANLTSGTISVVSLGNGYYTLAEPLLRQLVAYLQGSGVIKGYMVRAQPPDTNGLIRIGGEAPVKMVVYWDFLCPFSARFANTTFPLLVRYAERGLATLYLADLLIHPEAFRLHKLAHCVYEKYGVKKLLEYIRDAFHAITVVEEALRKNKNADINKVIEDYVKKLMEKYGISSCNATPVDGGAKLLGISGTPTVVMWGGRIPAGWLVVITGAQPPMVYVEELQWAAGKPAHGPA